MVFFFFQMQICYILYPGDEPIEGKILRLKQQYTLCSASLQDIIARFERRSGTNVNWEEFPEKVAVQMNDTHPTLCIPELMRILIDVKGLSWKDAWNITQRYSVLLILLFVLVFWGIEGCLAISYYLLMHDLCWLSEYILSATVI